LDDDRQEKLCDRMGVDSFGNMKTRILSTIIVSIALFLAGRVQAQSPPPSVADIKILAKGGVSEEVILSQIRNSHAAYRLSTADILDLKDSGVSEKVIDFMINTAAGSPVASPLPAPAPVAPPVATSPPPSAPMPVEAVEGSEAPPPIAEQIVVSPGPEYVWIPGYWAWHRHHWEWFRGRWDLPPRHGAVWIGGRWEHHGGHVIWIDGYWR
jgi:hypothetical protein